MSNETRQSLTDQFAPLPEHRHDVTISNLARFEAVHAFQLMQEARRLGHKAYGPNPQPGDVERHAEKTVEAGAWFTVLLLLRAIGEHAPDQADEVARVVWEYWNGRDDAHEFVWQWLTQDGVDVLALIDAERKQAEQATGRRAA